MALFDREQCARSELVPFALSVTMFVRLVSPTLGLGDNCMFSYVVNSWIGQILDGHEMKTIHNRLSTLKKQLFKHFGRWTQARLRDCNIESKN